MNVAKMPEEFRYRDKSLHRQRAAPHTGRRSRCIDDYSMCQRVRLTSISSKPSKMSPTLMSLYPAMEHPQS